jgi:hypothetical protein
MKLDAKPAPGGGARDAGGFRPAGRNERMPARQPAPSPQGAMQAAFAKLQRKS